MTDPNKFKLIDVLIIGLMLIASVGAIPFLYWVLPTGVIS